MARPGQVNIGAILHGIGSHRQFFDDVGVLSHEFHFLGATFQSLMESAHVPFNFSHELPEVITHVLPSPLDPRRVVSLIDTKIKPRDRHSEFCSGALLRRTVRELPLIGLS